MRYALTTGPAIRTIRVKDERIEVLDAEGTAIFFTRPAFAIDAKGTTRPVRARTIDGGFELTLDAQGLEPPIVVDPAWTTTSMGRHRTQHVATALSSGKVLVTGGNGGSSPVSSCEIYDPSSGTWSPAPSMTVPRRNHAAVLLSSGQVLVCGGYANGPIAASCETYDPTTNAWSVSSGLNQARARHFMVRLADGRVLAGAGDNNASNPYMSSAELWDNATGAWTEVAAMAFARLDVFAVLLGSGKVLVAGGNAWSPTVSNKAEIFDPTTKTWSTAPAMLTPRSAFAGARLPDGRVMVFGGNTDVGQTSAAEYFDPSIPKWSAAPSLLVPRFGYGVASLPAGILVAGGSASGASQLSTVELFDIESSKWVAAPSMSQARSFPTATEFAPGKVIVVGSTTDSESTAEVFAATITGAACTRAVECASGYCVSGVCCATACIGGTCTASTGCVGGSDGGLDVAVDAPDTGAFPVDTGSIVDSTVVTDTAADGGTAKADGLACGAAAECVSGYCVDGVCCNAACDGQCQACDLAGKAGTCGVVSGAPHGIRPRCGDDATCAGKCDGVDTQKCVYPASALSCGTACDGEGVASKACDGKGACVVQATNPCTPFVCASGACLTSCTKNADCVAASVCVDSKCVPVTQDEQGGVTPGGGCGCQVAQAKPPLGFVGLLGLALRWRRRRASRQA